MIATLQTVCHWKEEEENTESLSQSQPEASCSRDTIDRVLPFIADKPDDLAKRRSIETISINPRNLTKKKR